MSEDHNVKKTTTFISSLALCLPVNIVHLNFLSSLKLWSLCSLWAVFDTVFLMKPSECPQLCQNPSIKMKSGSFMHAQSVKVWFCSWWYLLLGTEGWKKKMTCWNDLEHNICCFIGTQLNWPKDFTDTGENAVSTFYTLARDWSLLIFLNCFNDLFNVPCDLTYCLENKWFAFLHPTHLRIPSPTWMC